MKKFLLNALGIGIGLVVVFPLIIPLATSLVVLVFSGHWNGWDPHTAWRILRGASLSPR